MAYRDDIIALGANHLWPLDGNANDVIGSLNYTNSGGAFTGPQICLDAATSYVTNGTNDSALAASDPDVQNVTVGYCYSLWFQTSAIQQPPCRVFGDGGQTANNSFFLGFGNSIVCEADCDPDVVQVGSNTAIVPDRPYHLALVFRDIGGGFSQLEFFLDGVSQGTANVSDVSGAGRSGFRIGGVTGTTTYSIGGSAFQLVSPVNGYYGMVNSFVGANVPTNEEIRTELFEKGAVAEVTVTSDTQPNMQSAIDALVFTTMANSPLAIRIEPVLGGGDLDLTFPLITFPDECSVHVQWLGTDTLNITNVQSNASIVSTPNGGTVNIINSAFVTVTPLVPGSRVSIFEAGTNTILAQEDSSSGTTSMLIRAELVDIAIYELEHEAILERNIDLTGGDITLSVNQVPDRQYENP